MTPPRDTAGHLGHAASELIEFAAARTPDLLAGCDDAALGARPTTGGSQIVQEELARRHGLQRRQEMAVQGIKGYVQRRRSSCVAAAPVVARRSLLAWRSRAVSLDGSSLLVVPDKSWRVSSTKHLREMRTLRRVTPPRRCTTGTPERWSRKIGRSGRSASTSPKAESGVGFHRRYRQAPTGWIPGRLTATCSPMFPPARSALEMIFKQK